MAKRWKYALVKDRYLRYLYRWKGNVMQVRNQFWVRWFPSVLGVYHIENMLATKTARLIGAERVKRELERGERCRDGN